MIPQQKALLAIFPPNEQMQEIFTFLITCQNFLLSSYHAECAEYPSPQTEKMENLCENEPSIKLLQSFPYSDIHCHETNRNTKFNYLDVQLNPTNSEVSQSPTICSSRTCLAFHQSQVDIIEDIAPIEYCTPGLKIETASKYRLLGN